MIALLQFIQQKSVGLTLLGESIFSVNDPGVAKIVINGDIFVRAYGLFPHPNILGGFLAVSLLLTMAYPLIFGRKLFHVEQFNAIWWYRGAIFVQMMALLLSFSKSAVLAFIIGSVVMTYAVKKMFHVEQLMADKNNVPRGTSWNEMFLGGLKCSTWNNWKLSRIGTLKNLFHVEQIAIIGGIVLLGMILTRFDFRLFLIQPSVERLFYMNTLTGLVQEYCLQGVGIGQFVLTMQQFFDEKLLLWQFQPIHNVFFLIFSETGVIGLGLFLWFFVFLYQANNKFVPRGTNGVILKNCSTWNNQSTGSENTQLFHVEHGVGHTNNFPSGFEGTVWGYLLRSLLISVAIIMMFDHYFWDIQQGQLLLWVIFALAALKK